MGVEEHSLQGEVTVWPSLQRARSFHACGRVGQVLLVAGGFSFNYWGGIGSTRMTEILRSPTGSWETLPALLPYRTVYANIATLNFSLYLTGGSHKSIYEEKFVDHTGEQKLLQNSLNLIGGFQRYWNGA